MARTFISVREAIAYYYAAIRGPKMARPRYDNTPRSTHRDEFVHMLIGTLLHSECGVAHDSQTDKELRAWALQKGPRTKRVRRIYRMMLRHMRDQGLKYDRLPTNVSPDHLSGHWRNFDYQIYEEADGTPLPEPRTVRTGYLVRWGDNDGRKCEGDE